MLHRHLTELIKISRSSVPTELVNLEFTVQIYHCKLFNYYVK